MYTFDTNAVIYYLKSDSSAAPVVSQILDRNIPVYISTITELELFSYSDLSYIESELIDFLLKELSIIPFDSKLARMAGEIRRKYGIKTSDSAIAATALFTGSTLLTRNVKDFKRIPNLKLEKI